MANDFLNKYKQKSDDTMPDIEQNVSSQKPMENVYSNKMNYEQKSEFAAPKRMATNKSTKTFPILPVAISGAVVVIIIILLLLFLGRGIEIKNMVGWVKSDADLWANENNVLIRVENEFSDDVETGYIISQNPVGGEKIKKGDFFEIIVSNGPDYSIMVQLPDLMKMNKAEVESWAKENKMSTVRVTTEESSTVPQGEAIKVTVNDSNVLGKEVRRDTPIYVVFSKGAGEGEPVEMPDFTMMSLSEVKKFADDNGLVLDIVEEYNDDAPKETILKQSLKAEETVNAGDKITINVSLGKKIIVPNFYEFSKDMAQVQASQMGITVMVSEKYSSYKEDALISQSVKSGTIYEEDAIIELVYSLGNTVVLSSFVGQSEDGMREWIKTYNDQGAGISLYVQYTTSNQAAGTILSQNKENKTIGIWEDISIVVSKGSVIYVPDLINPVGGTYADIMTREKAIEICEALQIVPIFVAENKEGRLPGEVWSQSLTAGKEIKQGTTMQIKYVPVTTTNKVPDFTGLTKADIIAKGYDKQFAIYYNDGEYVEGMDGKVVSQSIAKDKTVAPGTEIQVYIGIAGTPEEPDEPVVDPVLDEPIIE